MSADAPAVPALSRPTVVAWRNAVFAVFAVNGLALATWMSRVPAVRDSLGATTAEMGWIVFAIAVGSIVGLSSAGQVLAWAGSRRTIAGSVGVGALGLAIVGGGAAAAGHGAVVVLGLALLGAGMGMCDVAMNVEGAAAERALGRTVMPLFHAAFSGGTIAGAALGALAEWGGVSTAAHFGAAGVVSGVIVLLSVRFLQLDALGATTASSDEPQPGWRERLGMWGDRGTLLIGLIVLGMAFAEGSANDWLALAMVDGHSVSNSTGAVIYGVFVTAMTAGRILGVFFLDRFGRVPVLRATTALAVLGLLIVIFVPSPAVATVGVVLWGLGASLGFPVGMSAAADDSRTATARVSIVATIGYFAFLVGPPAIGFLGDAVGLLRALILVLVLVAVAGLAAPSAREKRT
ncbi:MFS transporter [Cryptosporangium minutisporangium]|uniref:MFS transporter n=1 Tax=Cryptosporangium minutisporangium TaxID=113569 RepID=A0ABP6T0V8_9ACTN